MTAQPATAIDTVNLEETLLASYLASAEASLQNNTSDLIHTTPPEDVPTLAVGMMPSALISQTETQTIRVRDEKKIDPQYQNIGRNDPCPCGSGKKFKQCHGK